MNRNIVLITIDSLRADHCGFMGYEQDTTPTLDSMADAGLVFENAIAPGPTTFESMPAIFTGDLMVSHANGRNHPERTSDTEPTLDRRKMNIRRNMRRETIPEWFDRRGYSTMGFTPNPYTGAYTDFSRGFDFYDDFLDGGEGFLMRKAAYLPILSEMKHLVTLMRSDRAMKPWTDYYDQIVDTVKRVSEPYFLWIFLLDAHSPYLVDGEYRSCSRLQMYYHNWRLWKSKKWTSDQDSPDHLDGEILVDLYDGTIRFVDEFLRRLWNDLNHTDPALIIHADHGEAFGEHGTYGHRSALYEENLHVPLVVYNADRTGSHVTPYSLVSMPSLLRAVSTGTSIDIGSTRALSKSLNSGRMAIRGRDWKYIGSVEDGGREVGENELYDLRDDPLERVNLATENGHMVDECQMVLRQHSSHERESIAVYKGISEVISRL